MDKIGAMLDFQGKALGLRAYRQSLLSENIANADTPNYKAKDFDFATALKSAMGKNPEASVVVSLRTPTAKLFDGNTVDMDVERAAFSENALRYEAGLAFVSHLIKMQSLASSPEGR